MITACKQIYFFISILTISLSYIFIFWTFFFFTKEHFVISYIYVDFHFLFVKLFVSRINKTQIFHILQIIPGNAMPKLSIKSNYEHDEFLNFSNVELFNTMIVARLSRSCWSSATRYRSGTNLTHLSWSCWSRPARSWWTLLCPWIIIWYYITIT